MAKKASAKKASAKHSTSEEETSTEVAVVKKKKPLSSEEFEKRRLAKHAASQREGLREMGMLPEE